MLGFLMVSLSLYGQINHEDYLKSNPDKKEFDGKQWNKLKGKMKSESSGQSSSEGDGNEFNSNDYSSGSSGEQGDFYEYYEEEYKGEYSEYQNYEDYEDYEYSEYDDYEYYDNESYYYNENEKEGYEYYEKPQDKSQSSSKKNIKLKNNNLNVSSGALSFTQIILIVLGIAILAFIVYYLFMRFSEDSDGAKVKLDFNEMAPSEIPKSELERRLEEALAKGDYREAIRIYFIFIIKDLADKNWIKWEKKKTNFSYLMEMRSRPQYDLFNKSVSIFEIAWYGNYQVNQHTFKEVEPTFKELLNSIHR